jgi:aminobenzoyl-glutamate transport protein
MSKKVKTKNENEVGGFLKSVEKIGNSLPHPAMIFVILAIILIVIAELVARSGYTVDYYDAKLEEEVKLTAVSLLNADGLKYIFNSATSNFTGFAPLGTVLVAMLGVGVSENSGLFESALKKLLLGVNPRILTAAVVFAGVISNIASDAGYVVVIPLGAMIFASVGRHPIAGLAAAFSGVSGGFSANLIIGSTDPLLTGITNEALSATGIDMQLNPTCNWYFLFVSTFLITIVGTLVTELIVEKNLGEYKGDYVHEEKPVTEKESRGLRNAGIALLIYVVIMGFLMFMPNAVFKTEGLKGIEALKEFLNNGLMLAILLLFLIPGLAYGKTVGTINNSNDLVATMTKSMQGMAGYLVLSFFAAQFVSYFDVTNIGKIISVTGAQFLERSGLTGITLIVLFIILSAFLNLFMGSASAKWAIMAPIFVPMMYKIGIHPALIQVAYRIGDSTTNLITPLMVYFAMIVVFMQKYDKKSGLGTLISTMLPYSLFYLLSWTVLIVVWMLLGIPVGPGAPLYI